MIDHGWQNRNNTSYDRTQDIAVIFLDIVLLHRGHAKRS